mmetsp:Transcript_25573/g.36010  ORF Transcript_25573/g.36010 Transcript_25573/m.36010 type:complete len:317 (-) Transcript_25573:98-1048(-)
MSLLSFSSPPADRGQPTLDSLTSEEIEQAERDKFGIDQVITEETPEIIQNALEQLDEELQTISEKEAYELAEMFCPDYVRSTNFRLMFLRSTKFDAAQAAQKMVIYWSRKVELFGPDRAFRKMSVRDFEDDEGDRLALALGGICALPEPDEAGRRIIYSMRSRWVENSKSMVRLSWLALHVALEDNVSTQQHGMVGIVVNTLSSQPPDISTHRYHQKINRIIWRDFQEALPLQIMSAHTYVRSSITHSIIMDNMLFAIGRHLRARYCHYNIFGEFLAALEAHGMDETILPAELGGSLDFNYEEWLDQERRRVAELL